MTDIHTIDHAMTRLDISTDIAFDDFRAAFEAAAPAFDPEPFQRILIDGGSWDDVRALADANAPNGLMIYAAIDAAPLLSVAGHSTKAVEYLLGNHVIAETMFGHDPKVLLYAPLRVLIHDDREGNAVFSIDQPSKAFNSFGITEITEVGKTLDRKVVGLLEVLGVEAGDVFDR